MNPSDFGIWLRNVALPMWAKHGVDYENGGFHELLSHDLIPVERPRRARLTARQVYCFATGSKFGWDGPGRFLTVHGSNLLMSHYIRSDKTIRRSIGPDGTPIDDCRDLYDDAFVLFALAAHLSTFGNDRGIESLARKIAERTISLCRRSDGALADPGQPVLANPLMHLAEAALAWLEATPDQDGFWRAMARTIFYSAREAGTRDKHNLLPEIFVSANSSMDLHGDPSYEPGHQYEWAWLFLRWSDLDKRSEDVDLAFKMIEQVETHGLDEINGVVVSSIDQNLSKLDCSASLWAQTERAKAWHLVLHHEASDKMRKLKALEARDAALSTISKFLSGVRPGLWHDEMLADGRLLTAPVKASSLYHLTCAATTMSDVTAVGGIYEQL